MHIFATSVLAAALGAHHVAAQAGCCSAWWFAPSGAVMTRLQSTMIIPPISTGKGVHFVWPGFEPANGDFVFQNVIGDQEQPGKWSYATWYGPYDTSGDYYEYAQTVVHEGDAMTTDFELDVETGDWIDNWTLEAGAKGKKAGEKDASGGVQVAFPKQGALTDTIFEIELQAGATWDFGPVTFENIIMEVNSTDTTWCTEPSLGSYDFKYTMSTPQATVNPDKTSSCYIARLKFVSP